MKTRILLLGAIAVAAPLVTMAACNGDNSNNTDSGPHNGDAASDVQQQNDTGPGQDGGSCSTGLSFDNTLVPGWPSNIPQP